MIYRMLEAILLGFPPGDGPSQKGKGIDKDSGYPSAAQSLWLI